MYNTKQLEQMQSSHYAAAQLGGNPVPEPNIPQTTNNLYELLNATERGFSTLCERLGPILRPASDKLAAPQPVKSPTLKSPLTMELENIGHRIHGINAGLDDLLTRIDFN